MITDFMYHTIKRIVYNTKIGAIGKNNLDGNDYEYYDGT
jgi:hypothetical protein